jgi:hypothetical protein
VITLVAAAALAAPAAAQVVDDDPGAASRGPGDVHVFTRGADASLWTASWTGVNWSPWGPVPPGVLTSGPAAASRSARLIDVVVRGIGGVTYHRVLNGTEWSHWGSLGGVIGSKPGVAARRGTPYVDVVGTGTNSEVFIQTWAGRWTGWQSIGGAARGGPAVVSYLPGYVHVFVRGTNDQLYVRAWTGSAWTDWVTLGGTLSSSPAAVSQDADLLDVFARGGDGAIWQRAWNGSAWLPWKRIPGEVSSGPAAAAEGLGKITLFARRGGDVVANVYDHGRGPEEGWSGWQVVRPPAEPEPPPPPLCGGTAGPSVTIERRPRATVAFGSRPRVTGRVRNPDGSAVPDAEVRILAVGRDVRELERTRSSRKGGFSVRIPRGPSRTVQAGVPAAAPAGTLVCSGQARIRVRAGVTLRVPRRVRGRRIPFSGRLRAGPIPRRGLLVQLEAFEAGRWREFRSVRTSRRGRFKTSYRLQRTTAPRSFRFRARVRTQPPYPYALGSSRAARVRVVP